jgi:hypothetical protein
MMELQRPNALVIATSGTFTASEFNTSTLVAGSVVRNVRFYSASFATEPPILPSCEFILTTMPSTLHITLP